jgi:hypothetical protein
VDVTGEISMEFGGYDDGGIEDEVGDLARGPKREID